MMEVQAAEAPTPEVDLTPLTRRPGLPKKPITTLEEHEEYYNFVARWPANQSVNWQRYYVVERFRPTPGDVILDVGSFMGSNLIRYAMDGYEIDGVEVAVAYCRKTWDRIRVELPEEAQGRIHVYPMPIEKFRPMRAYNKALLCEVLEHTVNPAAVMKKIHECLTPGGVLFCATPLHPKGRTEMRFIERQHMDQWLQEAGYHTWDYDVIHPNKSKEPPDWGVSQLLCYAYKGE